MPKQGFSGQPILRPFRSAQSCELWTLMNTVYYVSQDGRTYEAPRGMLTDLASIPALAGGLFRGVDHRLPGVIHDARYLLSPVTGEKRADLDSLFAEMCLLQGASPLQGKALHAGLDLGGWHAWDDCQAAGVTWGDFDVSVLTDEEVADYRVRFKIPDLQPRRRA
ncbi:DUF1353 domain-containing protein [Pseudomonas sp. GD03730]|uniref:DUF1353 domain-containing protein n=1 Tax=Pseudomonas sp. GD03730 TaxID=2975375 RepID=UPI0024491459|nr:DUF1353 domain-containing protein [Pseudomonas sp. GD03730]MDH1403682.1 DUF1353 domain-containing protein [Pseudomonas sp. GD03730]